jgi:NTE family protein
VFHNEEITLDAVIASACLPMLYKAVEIDGVPYWDGGYMGNPPIYPLVYHTDVEDVLLIQINPLERAETPKTARDIMNRMNEITFNSTLLRELRAIDFVKRLREEGQLPEGRYKALRMHRIDGGDDLLNFSASSKFNTNWVFLQELKNIGRARASSWLEENKDQIGEKSTFDLRSEFE